MPMLVGLGNPGPRHARDRHNAGFVAIDAIARRHGADPFRKRFGGETADVTLGGVRTLLLKPLTYMNESGRSVGEALRFLKLPLSEVVVLHDELDLALGSVRTKSGGGNAGHNGLRSISALCGNEYRRVRIGIGHPGVKELVHGHVLSAFSPEERAKMDDICDAIAEHAPLLAKGEDAAFQARMPSLKATAP